MNHLKEELLTKPIRKCRSCGLEIFDVSELDLFRVNNKSKYKRDNHCSKCHREEGKTYWTEGNGRAKRLEKYNITVEEYNNMFKKQKGMCKICGTHIQDTEDKKQFLSVDHCHETGTTRGLLCDSCNLGLGKFKDNEEYLANAIKYLKEYR